MESYFLKYNSVKNTEVERGVNRKVLANAENIMILELSLEKGADLPLHNHIHEQCSYVIEGKFEFEINGEKQILETGDSLYFGPNSPHSVTCLEAGKFLDVFTPAREEFLE